ncbi:MAG: efflux RND transporter periplasmic adaptor subunit [Provencibacterium sp.]|nr:efflux RND transporter periplasmic adaptor subunit [Provencibacterium sp.]
MKNVKKRVISILVCAVLVVAAGAGIFLFRGAQQVAVPAETQTEETPVPVSAMLPETGSMEVVTEFIGRVQPDESVNVFPKVAGTVLATHFEVGQQVKKGDLLFEIDPADIETQVAIAEASYNLAKVGVDRSLGSALDLQLLQVDSSLKNAKNAYSNANKAYNDYIDSYDPSIEKLEETLDGLYDSQKEAQAGVQAASAAYAAANKAYNDYLASLTVGASEANVQQVQQLKELERVRDEMKDKMEKAQSAAASLQASYETVKTQYDQAKDGYDVQLDQLRSAMRSANIALDAAEKTDEITNEKAVKEAEDSADAQLQQAQASLNATLKQLEYTKVTSPIDGVIELKNVEEHGMATQSSPAYIVTNKEIMVAKFNVPANAAQSMAVGDEVQIENGSAVYTGSVIEVGSMVDAQSGLFPVKARIEAQPGELLTGVSVKVSAPTERAQDAMLIPIDSLYHEDGKTYLYLLGEDGIAHKTYVQTGISDNERIAITSGLEPSSKIITSWNPNLKDGARVADAAAATQQPAASSEPEAAKQSSSGSQEG